MRSGYLKSKHEQPQTADLFMKTTRQRLLNIVITMSVVINLVMLGGLGYLASVNNHVKNLFAVMDSPVVVYVPKSVDTSDVKPSPQSPATQ